MTTTDASISAGWYADPAGPDSLRWWDGNQWTQHVRSSLPSPAPVQPSPFSLPAQQSGIDDFDYGRQWASSGRAASQYGTASNQTAYYTGTRGSVHVNNSLAWVGLGAGVAASLAILLKVADPGLGLYLPVFGITAIASSIRALIRYRSGSVTVLWAPIVGLVLGAVAELVLISLLAVGALGAATNVGTLNGSLGAPSHLGVSPADTINYSMGQGGVQYPPTANANLSQAAAQEGALVAKLRSTYGPGKYPSALHLNSNGQVVASDGNVLGYFLGRGWFIAYTLQHDGSYLLEMSAQPTDEVAVYYSISDEYWAWCGSTDASCRTASPVPPSTSQTPSVSSGPNA